MKNIILNSALALDANLKKNLAVAQSVAIFPWCAFKARRRREILASGLRNKVDTLYVSDGFKLGQIDTAALGLRVHQLPADFIANCTDENIEAKRDTIRNGIYLCTNSDVQFGAPLPTLDRLANLYLACPETIFLGWDWDNHHHLHISGVFAAHCDVYFPSHLSNDYELNSFGSINFHVPLSAYQWSRGFLSENLDSILRSDRSDTVVGRHARYGIFPLRNVVLDNINKHLPEVNCNFDTAAYRQMSPREKLDDWTKSKCHWIVPALHDLSTRVFDALITGGVAIVPQRFRSMTALKGMHSDDVIFYDEIDVVEPHSICARAVAAFELHGVDGILRRHRYCLDNHNVDQRVQRMLKISEDVLGV